MEKHLWVIDWKPGNPSVIPSAENTPDWSDVGGVESIVAEQFYTVLRGALGVIETTLRDYPYWRLAGHPADGRYVGEGGEQVYIVDGYIYNKEFEAWDALGLKPQDFDANGWNDVDEDVVRASIPTF